MESMQGKQMEIELVNNVFYVNLVKKEFFPFCFCI